MGLTRVMTLRWGLWNAKFHGKGLKRSKGKRVLVETLPFTTDEASAAEAGIER